MKRELMELFEVGSFVSTKLGLHFWRCFFFVVAIFLAWLMFIPFDGIVIAAGDPSSLFFNIRLLLALEVAVELIIVPLLLAFFYIFYLEIRQKV